MNKKKGIYGLIVIGLITLFFCTQLPGIQFNYDFNAFLPEGDRDLVYYEQITEEFGVYDDFLYLAIADERIYEAAFLDRVNELTQTLESWPEVKEVISPTNHTRWQMTPLGLNRIPLYRKGMGLDSASIWQNDQWIGQYIARNGGSVGLVVKHIPFPIKTDADAFFQKYQALLNSYSFDNYITSGKIQAQYEFVERLEADLSFNLAAAMGLVIITLALIFRTLRGVWIPLLTLVITVIWNVGLYALVGKELDVMMAIIPPILLIVSMSDVIHLCNKYNELIRNGAGFSTAITITVKEVGMATFLTSVTTAIGFTTLVILPIKPVRDFGLYTGIGIVLAYLIAFTLIPCLLSIIRTPVNAKRNQQKFLYGILPVLFIWTIRKRKAIIVISGIIAIVCIWMATAIRENTSILIGVEKDDPLAAPVVFFDQYFDGYKPFELTVTTSSETDIFDPDILEALDEVEQYLTNEHGVKHIQSPVGLIKSLNQAMKGGLSSAYTLPSERNRKRVKRLFESSQMADIKQTISSKDGVTWRINGRTEDIGSALANEKNERLFEELNKYKALGLDFRLTGTSYLIDKTNHANVRAILSGLLIAIGVIAIFILLLTRDLRLTVISVLPNILPLLVVGAIMGLLKVDLNLSTAIIFSVAFGIAVDDSIHFISRYALAKKKGRQSIYAIKRAFISTGKSIILTSIVLFAGFAIFLNSGFSATYYIGFFVSTTLIAALLADLFLLPALLYRKAK